MVRGAGLECSCGRAGMCCGFVDWAVFGVFGLECGFLGKAHKN